MKRFFVLLALLLLVASPALAANRVIDDADVLSASDENALEQAIAAVSQEYNFDIIILTKTSIDGRTATYYAADYYDDHGFGLGDTRDGVMVLLVTGAGVGNRDMGIISHGRGEKIFDLDAIYALEDDVLPYLRQSKYSSGMAQFVMSVRDRLIDYQPGNRAGRVLPVTLIIGLVVGLIVVFTMKSHMKTARRKNTATSYVREGSFQLSRVQDIYLYTTTVRHKIETESSGGHGGHSGGGGFTSSSGGHFTGHNSKF